MATKENDEEPPDQTSADDPATATSQPWSAPLKLLDDAPQLMRSLRALDELHRLGAAVLLAHRAQDQEQHIALTLLARATKTLHSYMLLLASGFSEDASSGLRSLVDLLIDVHWIWNVGEPERKQRLTWFMEHLDVDAHRQHEAWRIHLPDTYRQLLLQPLPSGESYETYAAARAKRVEVVLKRRKSYCKQQGGVRWLDYSWAPGTSKSRATEGNLKAEYEVVFALASGHLHTGPTGALALMVGADVARHGLDAHSELIAARPPRPHYTGLIVFACHCYGRLLNTIERALGQQPTESWPTAMATYLAAGSAEA